MNEVNILAWRTRSRNTFRILGLGKVVGAVGSKSGLASLVEWRGRRGRRGEGR